MQPDQLERAMLDPAAVFDTPEEIVSDADLTKTQKIEILRRWENQVADEAVALEEGMPGEESDLARRMLLALGALAGPIDFERISPTKQHGLPRDAVGKGKPES